MNFKQEKEEEEPMQIDVGNGFVLYTGGAKGTEQVAEELALQFGVQVEVLIPPRHPRSRTITPVSPRVLTLANPHIEEAAEKLGKRVPTDFHILHLIQRNYEIARRADTVYAFGLLEDDCRRVLGGKGGLCNWRWIKAKKSLCTTLNPKPGSTLYTLATKCKDPWRWALISSL